MTLALHPLVCGWIRAGLGNFLAGAEGEVRIPVPAWLVEHPRGRVLFDSGMHVDTQSDPAGRIGGLAKIFSIEFAPGEEIDSQLARLDVDAARIEWLVNSHLHFDHVGGNERLPNSRVLVQRREWQAGGDPDLQHSNAYDPRDYDLGQDLELLDGEHDIFGDGRVVCVPTYGHTPGHQSLRVELDSGPALLAADSCYMKRTLEELRLPPFAYDEEQSLDTLRRLREFRAQGVRIFFGHDPELIASLPAGPIS